MINKLSDAHYIGSVCPQCSSVVRYKSNRGCVACSKGYEAKRKQGIKDGSITVKPRKPRGGVRSGIIISRPEIDPSPILPQIKKPEERPAVIQQLQSDIEKFLASGGEITTVALSQVNQSIKHGTRHAYLIKRCNCGACVKWATKNQVVRKATI